MENVTGPVAYHGEGPVWSESWGGLRFLDLTAGTILTLQEDGVRRERVGDVVALVRPRSRGGDVRVLGRHLETTTTDGQLDHRGSELWSDPTVRFNDGSCGPDGSLFIGSMAYDGRAGAGTLFRIRPDLSVEVVLPTVAVSNGVGFSPSGERCFYVDSATRRIDVFDHEAGHLSDRRPFVLTPDAGGSPDGLAVDVEGGVWVAMWNGGMVRRYDSDGTLDEVLSLPVTKVSACAFGGPDLSTLYVTTSREGLPMDAEPEAGSLFAHDVGVKGLETLPFGG